VARRKDDAVISAARKCTDINPKEAHAKWDELISLATELRVDIADLHF
jgi:hypothetical protein